MFKIKLGGGNSATVEESTFWHTTAHVMALALKRVFKDEDIKFAIGPAIEEGFYYDFDMDRKITDEDFAAIEKEMQNIVKEGYTIDKIDITREDALAKFKESNDVYKVDIIESLDESEPITLYQLGEFVDLCKGPHIPNVTGIKAIKLLSVSGAYWRGDSNNKMLQRIYGISFPKASMLEEYMQILEERKQRDHRKIAKEQELFMTSELVGAGLPLFLPKGAKIKRTLEQYILKKEEKLGYSHVMTPSMGNVQLYKISGHWDHYHEDMFPAMKMDNEELVLRPMNCPHHMLIYKNGLHSYKDLPIKLGELAHDFRYETSGSLIGIERARQFCQNDAHIFVTQEQIAETFKEVIELILDCYKDFNITKYEFRLSLRDKDDKEKYYNDDQMWDNAEAQLRQILDSLGIEYYEAVGEAAFYGPKLDVQIRTALGHDISLSTCQLDFLLPEKFDLEYVAEDGSKKRPIVLHRAILGSIERFMAFLIEEYKGRMPLWLAPVQVKIIPIGKDQNEYAQEIFKLLQDNDILVQVDSSDEKMGYKIRKAQLEKVPYMVILGANEQENKILSVRDSKENTTSQYTNDEFIAMLKEQIAQYK